MRPCHADHPLSPTTCRLCHWCVDPSATGRAYRRLWGEPEPAAPAGAPSGAARRSLPCVFLGEVLDRLDCPCPARWLRACALHRVTTVTNCKDCPDYEGP